MGERLRKLMENGIKRPYFSQRHDAPALGLLAFAASFAGSWIPPLWADEVATISAARRSFVELWALLQSVDAVHGLYYVFMHVWGAFFGFSDLSVRFPSAIAVGLACYGTVRIGSRLGSRFVGCTAGLVLALLPRMVWAGSEARQYAFTAAILVALILMADRAWRSGRWVDWFAYLLVAVLGIHVFMFFVLAVGTIAVAAIVTQRRPLATTVSSLAALLLSLPFLFFVTTQTAQVNWIPEQSVPQHLWSFAVRQFFFINAEDRPGAGNDQPFAVLVSVALLGTLVTALAWAGVVNGVRRESYRTLLVIVIGLLVIPISSLLIASALIQPVYVLRYLTFIAPAFALLVALGLELVRRTHRKIMTGLVAVIVLCSLGPQLTIKTVVKDPQSGIAETLSRELQASDNIFYDSPWAKIIHPVAVEGIIDLSMERSPVESGTLWGTMKPMNAVEFNHRGRVWILGKQGAMDLSPLTAVGCRERSTVLSDDLALMRFDCP